MLETEKKEEAKNAKDGSSSEDDADEKELDRKPDPLYDPMMDKRDEEWMQKKQRKWLTREIESKAETLTPTCALCLGTKDKDSDGILSCPACFVQLCFSCQRYASEVPVPIPLATPSNLLHISCSFWSFFFIGTIRSHLNFEQCLLKTAKLSMARYGSVGI